MEIGLTTPAVLFPAISLLMLAYTNRYLALAKRIRELFDLETREHNEIYVGQIRSLRRRLGLIKWMQVFGLTSIIACLLSMIALFVGLQWTGEAIFVLGVILLLASLIVSLREIFLSTEALNIQLSSCKTIDAPQPQRRAQ